MEFIKKLISKIAFLMIISTLGEAKKDSRPKNELSFYIVAVRESAYRKPKKIYQYYKLDYSRMHFFHRILQKHFDHRISERMDIYCYVTRAIIEDLFGINLIFGSVNDPSLGLSLALYAGLKGRLQKETNIANIFATGSLLENSVTYTEQEKKLRYNYKEWKEYSKNNYIELGRTTKENLQFYQIGAIERKIATIIHYVLDEKLQNAAIFLPKKHECDIQRFINEIDSSVDEERSAKEPYENRIQDLIKLKRIVKKINIVDTYKDIENLSLEDIKTFSHADCPAIETSAFTQPNSSKSLQNFLKSWNIDSHKTFLKKVSSLMKNYFFEKIHNTNQDISYLQP
jgi:hypothetical protein